MSTGLKSIGGMILAFLTIIPLAIFGKLIGGGLIAVMLFSVMYYLIAWKRGLLKSKDPFFKWVGLIPPFNLMALLAVLMVIYTEKLGGNIKDIVH